MTMCAPPDLRKQKILGVFPKGRGPVPQKLLRSPKVTRFFDRTVVRCKKTIRLL